MFGDSSEPSRASEGARYVKVVRQLSSPFYGQQVAIEYYAPLSALEIAPLIDVLGPHFYEVQTLRRPRPPAATPLYEFAALALTFASGAVVKGFLEELGKELWRSVGSQLYRLYREARLTTGDPSMHAFALNTVVDDVRVTFRIMKDSLSEEEFASALEAARTIIGADMAGHEGNKEFFRGWRYTLEWDEGIKTWRSRRVFEAAGMKTTGPDSR